MDKAGEIRAPAITVVGAVAKPARDDRVAGGAPAPRRGGRRHEGARAGERPGRAPARARRGGGEARRSGSSRARSRGICGPRSTRSANTPLPASRVRTACTCSSTRSAAMPGRKRRRRPVAMRAPSPGSSWQPSDRGPRRRCSEHGIRADIVPERFVAEALVEALAGVELEGRRVLIARAAEARSVLPDALRERGARVDDVAVYDTVAEPLHRRAARRALPGPPT